MRQPTFQSPARAASRELVHVAETVDRLAAKLAKAERDRDALGAAADRGWVALACAEDGETVTDTLASLLTLARRHASQPLPAVPAQLSQANAARRVVDMLESAAAAAEAPVVSLTTKLADAEERFAVAARDILPKQPGLAAMFIGALNAAGLRAADDAALRFVDRFRNWLLGRGVHLTPEMTK